MPNNDCIKRSDALKVLRYYKNRREENHVPSIDDVHLTEHQLLAQAINSIPAADVDPVRHGRWVKMTGMMPPEFTGHYQCGECGWFCKKHSIKETDFDFCPGCGADMRKRNEDAE